MKTPIGERMDELVAYLDAREILVKVAGLQALLRLQEIGKGETFPDDASTADGFEPIRKRMEGIAALAYKRLCADDDAEEA